MLAEIIIPRMGDAAVESWVEVWKKSIGDAIEVGEVICVVAIDKAAFDIESPYEGTLSQILVQPNVAVAPGIPICRIDVRDEASSERTGAMH
jgi:pyruvate/2-oxoglutarate dehydrogenase complex dihydrolipoamide acyltransferase (E2) component